MYPSGRYCNVRSTREWVHEKVRRNKSKRFSPPTTQSLLITRPKNNGRLVFVCCNSTKKQDRAFLESDSAGTTPKPIATLSGHKKQVVNLAFSPSRMILASASSNMTVRVWDAISGAYITTLAGQHNTVYGLAFSSEGNLLASGSADKTICLWDMSTYACVATLSGHSDAVTCITFTPDGRTLASGSWDNTIRLWDVASRSCAVTLPRRSKVLLCLRTTACWLAAARTILLGCGILPATRVLPP
jgi:WD40 repeat protein